MDILEQYNNNRFDYRALISNPEFSVNIIPSSRDLNLIIGCHNRYTTTITTLKYLLKATTTSPINVGITVVEMDVRTELKEFCQHNDLGHIFLPFADVSRNGCHSEALCHNIGYFCNPKSKWYCFHCADVLVPEDFFTRLHDSFLAFEDTTFVQPFSERRLKYFTSEFSDHLNNYKGCISINELEKLLVPNGSETRRIQHLKPDTNPGAPGGSIVVRLGDFEAIGGYDPELFWGWGPEDQMFWLKLEYLYNNNALPKNTNSPGWYHLGSATYPPTSNSSPLGAENVIYLFHLDHPPSKSADVVNTMQHIVVFFCSISPSCRQDYFSAKKMDLLDDYNLFESATF